MMLFRLIWMLDSIKLEFLNDSHVNDVAKLANNSHISETSGVPPNCSEEIVKSWVNQNRRDDRSQVHFAIQTETQTVGCCILKKMDFANRNAELAYWVGEEFWGKGIATSAALLMRDVAFEFFNLEFLHSHYLKINNVASAKILARLGFVPDNSQSDMPVTDRFARLRPDVWTFVKLHRQKWLDMESTKGWFIQSSSITKS